MASQERMPTARPARATSASSRAPSARAAHEYLLMIPREDAAIVRRAPTQVRVTSASSRAPSIRRQYDQAAAHQALVRMRSRAMAERIFGGCR